MMNPAPKDATWQVSMVPPGSTKTVACAMRSIKMDRFYKFGTLNSGDPGSILLVAVGLPRAIGDQPQEDANRTFRESDPAIVVRDGNEFGMLSISTSAVDQAAIYLLQSVAAQPKGTVQHHEATSKSRRP